MDCHCVREKLVAGLFKLFHVRTDHQVADILTKPLYSAMFRHLISKISLHFRLILRGTINRIGLVGLHIVYWYTISQCKYLWFVWFRPHVYLYIYSHVITLLINANEIFW